MHIMPPLTDEEQKQDIINIFIDPGDFYFSNAQYRIHTLLGSCIAITLWHPRLLIGGMCHCVLPDDMINNSAIELNGRYTTAAMSLFEKEAMRHGTMLYEYQAKLFGGADMFTNVNLSNDISIGQKNIVAAKKLLLENDITILKSHTGKAGHRRITFNINSGVVNVLHVPLKQ